MAKKDLYADMGLTNMSYLLDPEALEVSKPEPQKESHHVDKMLATELKDFKNHPFNVDMESDDFYQLVDSIRDYGIIYPLLIRPIENGEMEVVAGHRRKYAAIAADCPEVPVLIRPMSDYEATIVMVHTNLQREKISISEKAKAYRMCLEAAKHQGKEGMDTATMVGQGKDSRRQVYRYIRLSYLLQEYMEFLDNGKLAVSTGVVLSYLDEDSQHELFVYIEQVGKCPSEAQALRLKELYEANKESLSYETIVAELNELPKKKTSGKVSFNTKEIAGFFKEGTEVEEMSNVIITLLTKYRNGDFDELLKGN